MQHRAFDAGETAEMGAAVLILVMMVCRDFPRLCAGASLAALRDGLVRMPCSGSAYISIDSVKTQYHTYS